MSHRAWIPLSLLLTTAATGCVSGPSTACRRSTADARRQLRQLCSDQERTLPPFWGQHIQGVRLAPSALVPVRRLPLVHVATLTGRTLQLDSRTLPHWREILQEVAPQAVRPPQRPPHRKDRRGRLHHHRRSLRGLLARARVRRNPKSMVLAVGVDVPARGVEELLRLLYTAGYRHVTFVVAAADAAPTAPQAWSRELPRELARWRARGCAAVVRALRSSRPRQGRRRCHHLQRVLPRALAKCNCAADPRPLLQLAQRTLRPLLVGARRVTLKPLSKFALKAPGQQQTWKHLAQRVLAARPDRFWIGRPLGVLGVLSRSMVRSGGFGLSRRPGTSRFKGGLVGRRHGAGGIGTPVGRGGGGGGGGGSGLGGFGSGPRRPSGYGRGLGSGKGRRMRLISLRITGGLRSPQVRRPTRRHLAELRYCYMALGPHKKRRIRLRLTVEYTVGLKGRVTRARITRTSLRHAKTEACILRAHRRWRFPRPKGKPAVVHSTYELWNK